MAGETKMRRRRPQERWGFPEERREVLQNRRLSYQRRTIHPVQEKITDTPHGATRKKPDATEYSQGRKRNGRRDRKNGSTNIRAAARCGEGEYRISSTDGDREMFWASSDNTEVLENFLK